MATRTVLALLTGLVGGAGITFGVDEWTREQSRQLRALRHEQQRERLYAHLQRDGLYVTKRMYADAVLAKRTEIPLRCKEDMKAFMRAFCSARALPRVNQCDQERVWRFRVFSGRSDASLEFQKELHGLLPSDVLVDFENFDPFHGDVSDVEYVDFTVVQK